MTLCVESIVSNFRNIKFLANFFCKIVVDIWMSWNGSCATVIGVDKKAVSCSFAC